MTSTEEDRIANYPTRSYIRALLLPQIESETNYVVEVQKRRSIFKDKYYQLWSILGSHVSYLFGIPLTFWLGFCQYGRHLSCILALGLIICHIVKDYLCLPRPYSPPVLRLSSTHNLEFGFPSSHAVNALGLPLFTALFYILRHEGPLSIVEWVVVTSLFLLVSFSVSFSRIYCGMHTPTDILGGFGVAIALVSVWMYNLEHIDNWIVSSSNLPITCVLMIILFLWSYPNKMFRNSTLDAFEDATAFALALFGIIFGAWDFTTSPFALDYPYKATVYYSYQDLGLFISIARIVIGWGAMIVWRIAAKAVCKKIFPPLFKYFDYSPKSEKVNKNDPPFEFVRFDATVATRMVVYFGIGFMAASGGPQIFSYCNLAQ